MFKKYKILALIPARAGSKGIKNKNVRLINGKPLIYYSIAAAKKCKFIDSIIVSTDSKKIANVAMKNGASVPFLRPKSLASDTSKTIDVVLYIIKQLEERNLKYDILILLQPTSPLRTADDIRNALNLFLKTQKNTVSINEELVNPLLFRTIKGNKISRIIDSSSTCRRQDLPKYYKVNGAIYINWIKLLNKNTSLNDNPIGYIMDRANSIDIDTIDDLKKTRSVLKLK